MYFFIALLLVPLFYVASRQGPPQDALPEIALLIGPFIYAVIGYVVTAIGCWLYNLIAGWSGGISFTLESDGDGVIATAPKG